MAYCILIILISNESKSKKKGKDQESIQSSTTPDPGYQWESDNFTIRGLMLWLFVGPTGVYLLDFFCSGIQFNLLLSPYPCFISLLYLDLYVLGDDALIS